MNAKTEAPRHWQQTKPRQRVRAADAILGPGGVRGSNFFSSDETLRPLLIRHNSPMLDEYQGQFADFGAWVGSTVDAQAEATDAHGRPRLDTYDRNGDPVNRVSHNPHYAACQRELYRRGFIAHSLGPKKAPFLTGFTLSYLLAQADLSLQLPASMNGAVALILAYHAPEEMRRTCLPGMLRTDGTALTAATWTTERSGDNDLSRRSATAKSGPDGVSLHGLKWFASSPDCDFALVTARVDGGPPGAEGLGLYLTPRRLPNGGLNRYCVRRLKNKIGTRGLATAEVELNGAWAQEVTAPGSGLKALNDAIGYTRIHNALAGAAIQRRALLEGIDHSSRRTSGGRVLTAYPAVQDTLMTLRTEYEADMALAFAAAAHFDEALDNPAQTAWLRLLTTLAKYRSGRNAADASAACLELFGGNGYVEDFICGRLHRDALALRVWEGPANVLARDLVDLMSSRLDNRQRFGRTVRAIIDKAPIKASRLASGLRKALAEYEETVRYLQRFPESGERFGVRLLAFMADLYAAALLLQQAGRDIEAGDARKAVVLDGFLRRYFPYTSTRLYVRTKECLRLFEPLITGSPISTDSDWEKGLRPGL